MSDERFSKELGEKIRQRRIELGITQEELAEKLGYASQQAVSLIELGNRNCKSSQIEEIARVLEVSVEWLIGRPKCSDGIISVKNKYIEETIKHASTKELVSFMSLITEELLKRQV